MDIALLGNVKAIIFKRRRIERQKPNGVDSKVLQVIQFLQQAREIADAVSITIGTAFIAINLS